MKGEVDAVCTFLANTLIQRKAPVKEVASFRSELERQMLKQYAKSWHVDNPVRGSGNRCLRVHPDHMDPLLAKVARHSGLRDIQKYFPDDLLIWVDPGNVSYKIHERASPVVLYIANDANMINGNNNNVVMNNGISHSISNSSTSNGIPTFGNKRINGITNVSNGHGNNGHTYSTNSFINANNNSNNNNSYNYNGSISYNSSNGYNNNNNNNNMNTNVHSNGHSNNNNNNKIPGDESLNSKNNDEVVNKTIHVSS